MLPSDGLEAFAAIVKAGSFTHGSRALHISQSAVSRRIAMLESALGANVFVRNHKAVELTSVGEELLRHCKGLSVMESELLSLVGQQYGAKSAVEGVIKIAAFSSILLSVVQPCLSGFVLKHPGVQLELRSFAMRELPALLFSGAADFVLTDTAIERGSVTSILLGKEHMVLVERADGKSMDVTLDHDAHDVTTERFFRLSGKRNPWRKKHYLGDDYGILQGVRNGLGRAVLSRHLISQDDVLREITSYKPLVTSVFVNSLMIPYETKLRIAVLNLLVKDVPLLLNVV